MEKTMKKLIAAAVLLSASGLFAAPAVAQAGCHGSCPHCQHHGN
jgi:hypothetical protein